jgi:mutator protein MutT
VAQDPHRHCPRCAGELVRQAIEGRARPTCPACLFVLYENPASAAAGVVFNAGGEVLLVRRRIEPYRGYWALPAGYQEIDEGPMDTVRREVREETGIEIEVLQLFDLLHVPDDPRKPANVAVYLCRALGERLLAGHDAEEARWYALDRLPERIGFQNYPRILARLRRGDGYPTRPWSTPTIALGPEGGSPS